MDKPKAFISYSKQDRELAKRIQKDLQIAGCDSWQFDVSAIPGMDAWDTILKRIEESDYLIALLSVAATESKGVLEELSYAHYQFVNNGRPIIIPVVLESEVSVPRQIVRAIRLPFREATYAVDFDLLLQSIGLQSSPFKNTTSLEATFTTTRSFDVEQEASVYAQNLLTKNPEVAAQFATMTEKMRESGRYRVFPPKTLTWNWVWYKGPTVPRVPITTHFIHVFFSIYGGVSNSHWAPIRFVMNIEGKHERLMEWQEDKKKYVFINETPTLKFKGLHALDHKPSFAFEDFKDNPHY